MMRFKRASTLEKIAELEEWTTTTASPGKRLRMREKAPPRPGDLPAALAAGLADLNKAGPKSPLLMPWHSVQTGPALPRRRFAKDFIDRAMANLDADVRNNLITNIITISNGCDSPLAKYENGDEEYIVRFGSICSGSEICLSVFPHLESAFRELVGAPVRLLHCWSCESDESKRLWITSNFDVHQMFGDVQTLTDPEGSWDFISDSRQKPLPVDIIIAGFSCRDASRLSAKQQAMRGVVGTDEAQSSTTGGTFRGLASSVKELKPSLVLMENVPGLMDKPRHGGQSNYQMVIEEFHSMEYAFASRVFDAAETGIPQRRKRLWMAAVRSDRGQGTANGHDKDGYECQLRTKANQILDQILSQCVHYSLDEFLVGGSGNEILQRWWPKEKLAADFSSDDPADSQAADTVSATRKWPDLHKKVFNKEAKGMAVHLDLHMESLKDNCHFHRLSGRQQDLLCNALAVSTHRRGCGSADCADSLDGLVIELLHSENCLGQ